jgi:fructokinase
MGDVVSLKLGIDLGGTKIEAALLDQQGQLVFRQRVPTPGDDYDAILSAVVDLSRQAEAQAGCQLAVGIGTPGALSPRTGLMRNSNTRCLNGRNLQRDLAERLERPLRMANDANCFALSEAMDGAGAGFDMVFGVIIGTGTGGGLVFRRQLISGPHAIAGEWGHNPLPWPREFDHARDCYCGKRGCIETYLSGPGMAANALASTGLDLDSRQIATLAAQHDARAKKVMRCYFDQMARALAHVINIVDPDVIVLGGGMSNIEGIYDAVPALLGEYGFSDFIDTPVVKARYGDSSGVRGAAWLWNEG